LIAANLQDYVEFVVAIPCGPAHPARPHITGPGASAETRIGKAAAGGGLYRHLDGAHMVFITAGMGGSTVRRVPIARMARERNIDCRRGDQAVRVEGVRRACADRASTSCRNSSPH
jgi:hypothetical protein